MTDPDPTHQEVARYLEEIVPPVLACFTDQDARVRYYACESMYNIAKVAKGELLLYFNDVFDALCKVITQSHWNNEASLTLGQLAADSELSVKNGAELLDRLVKDIVSESASTYVSVLQQNPEHAIADDADDASDAATSSELPTAFSLARFIPLLKERIHVINPFTRTFLVSWITLLDSIPDLELVFYLPAFLGGLFKFLSDPNRDVHVATQGALERFLTEIKRIARIKRGVEESRRERSVEKDIRPTSSEGDGPQSGQEHERGGDDHGSMDGSSAMGEDGAAGSSDGDWMPGQDVQVDHPKILEILVMFLDPSSGKDRNAGLPPAVTSEYSHSEGEIQLTALRWVESFFEICPEDILPFVPRLLARVLPAMASDVDPLRQAAHRVNTSLMEYIASLSEDVAVTENPATQMSRQSTTMKEGASSSRRNSTPNARSPRVGPREGEKPVGVDNLQLPPPYETQPPRQSMMDLDYAAAVNTLTLQFLNEHEATRVGALSWLIMLHRKAPRKVCSAWPCSNPI